MSRLPEGFIAQIQPLLGEDIHDFLESYRLMPHRGIRFSKRRVPPLVPGLLDPILWAEDAWYLSADATAGSHPLHDAGAYYIQEPSAMAAVAVLRPKPCDLVLDLCAAPGGKASQIGDMIKGEGALIANEIHPARARVLARNLERMGIVNAAVTNESPQRLADHLPQVFDKILVDAPCSGEGMFRREPESRLEWRPESPAGCAMRQAEILRSAAIMLRPGGRMTYSTCTFNRTENEGVIQQFLADHPDFRLVPFALPGLPAASSGMLRIWPHQVRGEGHFIALLEREGKSNSFPSSIEVELSKELEEANALIQSWAELPFAANLLQGHWAIYRPEALPDLSGLRVISRSVPMAERQGKHWKPAHALALISQPRQMLPVDEAGALRFQQGHPLPAPDSLSGWAAPALSGWPLGWGKASQGILKNHYPKGLRRPL